MFNIINICLFFTDQDALKLVLGEIKNQRTSCSTQQEENTEEITPSTSKLSLVFISLNDKIAKYMEISYCMNNQVLLSIYLYYCKINNHIK